MKPTHDYTGHQTFDLTECKVHVLDNPDGTRRLVAFVPKTFSAGAKTQVNTVNGAQPALRPFLVSAWEEIVIIPVLPARAAS